MNPIQVAGVDIGVNEASNYLQFRRNKKEWDRRFDKQSYPNQVAEMEKAGLNKALMYQKGAMSAPNPSSDVAGHSYDLAKTSVQAELVNEQKQLLRKQAITEIAKADKTREDAKISAELARTSKQLQMYKLEQERQKIISQEIDNQIKDKTKRAEIDKSFKTLLKLEADYNLTNDQRLKVQLESAHQDYMTRFFKATGTSPTSILAPFSHGVWNVGFNRGIDRFPNSQKEYNSETKKED